MIILFFEPSLAIKAHLRKLSENRLWELKKECDDFDLVWSLTFEETFQVLGVSLMPDKWNAERRNSWLRGAAAAANKSEE